MTSCGDTLLAPGDGFHLEEVMPVVDKAYNVSRNREPRAIAGLSMGGAESLYVGLREPRQICLDRRLQLSPDDMNATGRRGPRWQAARGAGAAQVQRRR